MEISNLEALAKNGGVDKDGYPTQVRKDAIDFTKYYDGDNECPQEAMEDAYVAGFARALEMMKN